MSGKMQASPASGPMVPTAKAVTNALPLDGITVLDLTHALAGPQATMMLADLGARVIKVEPPAFGDDTRGWGPPFLWPGGAQHGEIASRVSSYFLAANRNKESLVLDLKNPSDHEVLVDLVRKADVFAENFRAGALDRLGLSVAQLTEINPRLITLSITGFGHDGPESDRPGYDQIVQGEAGLMSLTGEAEDRPQKVGVPIADVLAGMNGAFGVLAALIEREHTGVGKVVRTSLLSSVVGVHAFQGTRWTVAGHVGRAAGNHHPSICPYGLFHCRDGAVQIAIGSESLWQKFSTGFGIDGQAQNMSTNAQRVENAELVRARVERVFSSWEATALLERLRQLGIPAGRVRSLDEVYEWDQTHSQHMVVEVEHETLGPILLPGSPIRLFDLDGTETSRVHHSAPPILNAHAQEVRTWARV